MAAYKVQRRERPSGEWADVATARESEITVNGQTWGQGVRGPHGGDEQSRRRRKDWNCRRVDWRQTGRMAAAAMDEHKRLVDRGFLAYLPNSRSALQTPTRGEWAMWAARFGWCLVESNSRLVDWPPTGRTVAFAMDEHKRLADRGFLRIYQTHVRRSKHPLEASGLLNIKPQPYRAVPRRHLAGLL